MERPDHISIEDWEAMTPRARKRAINGPDKPRELTYTEKLVSVYGGKRWQKAGKDRIYFNNVEAGNLSDGSWWEANGYYDVIRDEWACDNQRVSADAFKNAVMGGAAK